MEQCNESNHSEFAGQGLDTKQIAEKKRAAIVSGMFVPFAILMMPVAKQTAKMHLANWLGVILLYVVCYMPMNVMRYSGYLVNNPSREEIQRLL